MPYIHTRDAQTLRDVLMALRRNRMSSQKLLFEIYGGKKKTPIGRSALDKFIQGAESNNPQQLGIIWEHLQKNYPLHFPRKMELNPNVFGLSLVEFFKSDGITDVFQMDNIRANMSGHYVMYRPDWAPQQVSGYYRVSGLEIENRDGWASVTEIQDFRHQQPSFEQKDFGSIFSLGKYIYFLTKEKDGTCVKLGVVNAVFPTISKKQKVEWFHGVIFGASHLGIFPHVKFFCRRISEQKSAKFGVMKIEEVSDKEALSYLLG